MQETVSSFYNKITKLSSEEVVEYISFFGEKILDHSGALVPENIKALCETMPFSLPFIKKIVETPDLREAYWKSPHFKKELIEDIEISHLLIRNNLLEFYELDYNIKQKILKLNLDEELSNLYFELLNKSDSDDTIFQSLKSMGSPSTYLSKKYFNFLLSLDGGVSELIEKNIFVSLIPDESIIQHFIDLINEGGTDRIDLSPLSENQAITVLSKINAGVKFGISVSILKSNSEISKDLQKSSNFMLFVCDMIPKEYLKDILEEKSERDYASIMRFFLSDNRELIVPENKINDLDSLIDRSLSLSSILEIFNKATHSTKGFSSALYALIKEDSLKDISEQVIHVYKDFIEENEIYVNKLERFNIIDLSAYKKNKEQPILLIEDVQKLSSMTIYEIMNLMYHPELSLEVFDACLTEDLIEQYEFNRIIPLLNKEKQTKVFEKISFNKKINSISLFNKIDDDLISSLLVEWMDSPLSNIGELSTTQLNLLLSKVDIKSLDLDKVAKISKVYLNKDADAATANLLISILEKSPSHLISVARVCKISLIESKLLSEDLFRQILPDFIASSDEVFMRRVLASEKYFSFLKKEEYPHFYSALHKVLDPSLTERIATIIESADSPNILEDFVDNIYLEQFYKTNTYFSNQVMDTRIRDLSGDALRYALKYKKQLSVEDICERSYKNGQESENLDILWPFLKPLLEQKNPALAQEVMLNSLLLKSKDEEKVNLAREFVLSYPDAYLVENVISAKALTEDYILSLLKVFNTKPVTFSSVKDTIKQGIDLDIVSLEKIVGVVDSADLMDLVYLVVHRVDQQERKFVRYLRKSDKIKYIPEDLLTTLDLLSPEKTWEFYNIKSDKSRISRMSSTQKDIFYQNLKNSFSDSSEELNPDLLSIYKFEDKVLRQGFQKISGENLKKFISKGIDENSLNKDYILDLIKQDLSRLNNLAGNFLESLLINLYKLGIKDVFSVKIKIDLDDSDLVELLNETNDQNLLNLYLKSWKTIDPYSKYSPSISKELVKSVTTDDINQETVSYEKGILTFTVSGIQIVKAAYSKKDKKWSFVSGDRKDLYPAVKSYYKKQDSKFPEKILGSVSIQTGTFEPKEEIEYAFSILEDDQTKLSYMRELGVSGSIKATAKRSTDFKYKIDVHFETDSSIGSREIQQEIKKKTFDIQKKLSELLKVSPRRTFGFELELGVRYADRSDISSFLKKKGFKINNSTGYFTSSGKNWDFKDDGSLNKLESNNDGEVDEDGNPMGDDLTDTFEIASPILKGKDGIQEAKKFLNNLFGQFEIESGEGVNAGLHVHHDIGDINKLEESTDDILRSYLPFQETLYSLIEDWRSESSYCSKIDPSNPQEGRRIGGGVDATGIVLTSYGTMEFRMKEGLENTKDILNWIIYTQNIVDAIYFKLTNKIEKNKDKLEKLSESSVFMLLDSMGIQGNSQYKIQKIRKLVGLQEKFYA